ncbi:atypical kinase COQ8B, mitochondrial-like isoform X2 [Watersipora subatra]|uniref:atypical kinase COQ8B, mitochondrial-like isoform X2 n=1 Tax=Watersipora subatra TaxID=2589382 RepID=UPI00355C52F1
MKMSRRVSDAVGVFRGLQKVAFSLQKTQCQAVDTYWKNSSLNQISVKLSGKVEESLSSAMGSAVGSAVSSTVSRPSTSSEKVDRLDKLIPKELKLPPVTDADLEELSKDIESFGFVAQEVGIQRDLTETSALASASVKNETVAADKTFQDTKSGNASNAMTQQTIHHQLSSKSREMKVPANRFSRIMSFGSLAAGLGVGAVAEATRRGLGVQSSQNSSPLFSDANMERIVSTLCRVRGAALKLGQMLSIQDNSLLNPQLQAAFERVRQSADFMPLYQLEKTMKEQLGDEWRSQFSEFDDKPFAAASIGQVHRGVLPDGQAVAVKVQYPGVAKSINSDINNLLSVLKVWQVLPKGLYAENLMDVSRHELTWECDYKREARSMLLFKELLRGDAVFVVPTVYPDLSTGQVLVTELIPGVPLDQCQELSQSTRNKLGRELLRLCLTELYDWSIMQTDPNWSNFFYDSASEKVYLLDFGATRQFNRSFVDLYIDLIKAAAVQDRQTILSKSKELGFLTGYESKAMVEAHIDAVSVLGLPCGLDEEYDFGRQDITGTIENIIPVMMKHRLGPPPEETYSLHRKLSGAFLLCAKLKSKFNVKRLYDPVFARYKYGQPDKAYQLEEES